VTDETLATASEAINVGRELRQELERVARAQGYDVTGLARRLLRDHVEAFDRARVEALSATGVAQDGWPKV
jgi:hypothetical protein